MFLLVPARPRGGLDPAWRTHTRRRTRASHAHLLRFGTSPRPWNDSKSRRSLNADFKHSDVRICLGRREGFSTRVSAEKYDIGAETPRGGLPRFYSKNLSYSEGDLLTIEDSEYIHMIKSLRLKLGDKVEIFDGNGGLLNAQISSLGKNKVQLVALDSPHRFPPPESIWTVAVAFANMKSGRADWLVEKCTELGATTLIPLVTQRSLVYSEAKGGRWERVALAASKQCQRLYGLHITQPQTLENLLPKIATTPTFLAYAGSDPILTVISKMPKMESAILLIGPEGDFTLEEISRLQEAGAHPVGLGNNRLRVETAAIKILSIMTSFQDL